MAAELHLETLERTRRVTGSSGPGRHGRLRGDAEAVRAGEGVGIGGAGGGGDHRGLRFGGVGRSDVGVAFVCGHPGGARTVVELA